MEERADKVISARVFANARAPSPSRRVAITFAVTTSKNAAQDAANDASPRAKTWRALHRPNARSTAPPPAAEPGGASARARPAADPNEHHADVDASSSGGFARRNDAMFQLGGASDLPTADENPDSHDDAADAGASPDASRTFQHSIGPGSNRSSTNLMPPCDDPVRTRATVSNAAMSRELDSRSSRMDFLCTSETGTSSRIEFLSSNDMIANSEERVSSTTRLAIGNMAVVAFPSLPFKFVR
mmetsp:Transcript_19874/g.47750  ORF Transcript_19874/g.47750 Transcript_19874/m.47750 type:complete len:243 (-) Transcript_19874:1200-1928(-)